jgi:hypothetical protein
MRPKDIIVGQKYVNEHFDGTIYLGVGEVVLGKYTVKDEFKNKRLVIISDECDQTMIGRIFRPYQETKIWWDGFKAI